LVRNKKNLIMRKIIYDIINHVIGFLYILRYSSLTRAFPLQTNVNSESFVLGNGPSLKKDLPHYIDKIKATPTFVVNDFSLSEEYTIIKPSFYVLVDSAYFVDDNKLSLNNNDLRNKVLENILLKTDWEMTIFIPATWIKKFKMFSFPYNITLKSFNRISAGGIMKMYNYLLKKNIISPSGSNVLISTIYLALNSGFKKIYLLGADFSWTKEIRVNKQNEVCLLNNHFYNMDDKLSVWYKSVGEEPFKMYEILTYLAGMFKGHMEVKKFADYLECRIINLTSESFIDAYERNKI